MIIAGPEKYRNLVDFGKLVQFLQKNHFPQEQIDLLHIHFVESFPETRLFFFMGKALGRFSYTNKYPLVELCWKELEKIKEERERLMTINEVLLHECLHLCDTLTPKKRFQFKLQSVILVLTILLLNAILFFFLRQFPYPWSGITLFLAEILTFIFISRLFYFLAPSERAARNKERLDFWVLQPMQPLSEPTEPELAVLPDRPNRKIKSGLTEKLPESLSDNFPW